MRHNLTPSPFDHAFTSGTKQLKSVEITMRSIIPVFGNMFKFASFLVVLAFILAALPAESESTTYEAPIVACKLEGAAIGVNGSTVVVNGVTITFSNWIPKVGSPGEFVGFTIDKSGYTFTVKAGNELLSGMGTTWSNPNGTSGSTVNAISNVSFCMNDGDPNDEALCYLIADNDGFGNNSPDGLTKLNEVFTELSIGLTGTDHIEALTQDTSTGILYGSDDKRFGSLNISTGAFTFIGNFGSGNGAQGSIDFLDIDGLAYDPFTKKMYAAVRRVGKDDVLIRVNIATGAAIVDAFGPGNTYVVVEKINGLQDIDDIAISTRNGVMYAIQNNDGNDSRLITINKATGATTDIGDLDVPNVEGLGFHPDGRLLGVNGDSHRSVMQIPIDPFTGVTIPVSSLGINGWLDYEGISCLTETDNKIQGTVLVQPDYIDLMLDKDAAVTVDANSDQIQYTVTVTNDNTHPVVGPNAPAGTGLAGVTVKLYRDNNIVGVYDGNDDFLASTVTGPGGTYEFPISANGDFIVTVDLNDNTDFLYAAAHGGVQVYDGALWSTVGAGSNPFIGEQVLAVVFDENNNRVFASSAASGIQKFQGGIWTAVNSGLPTGKINELFRGPNGEILAGTNSDGVYIFGGATWAQFGTGLDNEPIESLGSGPNGELLAGARESGAYFYNFITNAWVSIGNLPIFTVASMTAGPMGEIYAGAPGEGIYVITDTNFDGIPDVAYQVANFMTSAVIQDIVVAPNGDMWAATYGYGILYSNDGGHCWTRMNRGLNNLWTFAIERASDGTLFIGIWADGKGGIWRSRDGARNWEFLALPTRQIIALAIDPNNENVIYAGANIAGEGALFQSTDGGDTWHSQGQFIQPVWSVTIDPDNSDHILVGTLGDGIHESFDTGFTFAPMGGPVNGLANPYVFDMAYAPFGTPYAGQLFAATDSGMYRYDVFTSTWSLFGIGSEAFQFRTMAFSGTTIFGGTWNAGVIEYDALTNEWSDFGLSDMPVIAFAVHPQSQTLIIGTSGSGVFLSTNFRVSTAIEDEIVGSEIPTSFSLEANYPNPFNPQTTIPFSVQTTGQVRLAVYDMLGREIGLLIDGALAAGQHQVTWEAGDRPSGSYLVRMDAGGQTFTRTMVLLK